MNVTELLYKLKQIFTKQFFEPLNPDFSNIDEVYKNNLYKWLYDKCTHLNDIEKNGQNFEVINSLMQNPENVVFKRNNFELLESNFLKDHINKLNEFDLNNFDIDIQIQFEYYKQFIEDKKNNLKNTNSDEVKKEPQQIEFKDFFINTIDSTTINQIKAKYNNLDGKKMAILIYLLNVEFKAIEYILNDRLKARKHFILALNPNIKKTQGIDKYFLTNSYIFNDSNIREYKKDDNYNSLKKELETILK